MAFIEINNDENHVLIDDLYQNYEYKHKVAVTVALSSAGSEVSGTFTYQGHSLSAPVVATGLSQYKAVAIVMSRSATNLFTIKVVSHLQNISPTTATIYIFDMPAPSYVGGGLVVVRDSEGRVTFDSSKKYMKVLDVFSAVAGHSVQKPPVGELALVYTSRRMGYRVTFVGGLIGYTTTFELDLAVSSPSSITFISDYSYQGNSSTNPGPPASNVNYTPGHYMLIDVTDYL